MDLRELVLFWNILPLMATSLEVIRISPLQRPHYFTSSYTYKFFEKSDYCIVFRVKDCLSALLHLFVYLLIVTWEHRAVVLIPIFHAGKDVLNILSKVQIIHFATFIQRIHES